MTTKREEGRPNEAEPPPGLWNRVRAGFVLLGLLGLANGGMRGGIGVALWGLRRG